MPILTFIHINLLHNINTTAHTKKVKEISLSYLLSKILETASI